MYLLKNLSTGTFLVAQWLRGCLPMQGTRVQSLVWEDLTCWGAAKPMCHNYWSRCLEPVLSNQRSNCDEKSFSSPSSVQSHSRVLLFATPWTAALQASLSITSSGSPPKPMSIESVMPSNHLVLCHPLLLPPSIFPSIRVFSNESVLCIRWQKYWSFSFSISPSNEYSGLISFRMDWLDLLVI